MGTPKAENRSPVTRRVKGQRTKERRWNRWGDQGRKKQPGSRQHHKSQGFKELRNKILRVEKRQTATSTLQRGMPNQE